GFAVQRRIDARTTGPMVMFGTKCPSITSTWIQSAPAESTARISSPRRVKSADRREGAMMMGGTLGRRRQAAVIGANPAKGGSLAFPSHQKGDVPAALENGVGQGDANLRASMRDSRDPPPALIEELVPRQQRGGVPVIAEPQQGYIEERPRGIEIG